MKIIYNIKQLFISHNIFPEYSNRKLGNADCFQIELTNTNLNIGSNWNDLYNYIENNLEIMFKIMKEYYNI